MSKRNRTEISLESGNVIGGKRDDVITYETGARIGIKRGDTTDGGSDRIKIIDAATVRSVKGLLADINVPAGEEFEELRRRIEELKSEIEKDHPDNELTLVSAKGLKEAADALRSILPGLADMARQIARFFVG